MGYYIHHEHGSDGPYDLLGMIRKIRNGMVDKNQLLSSDTQTEPKVAYQFPEFYDVLIEQDTVAREDEAQEGGESISLAGVFKAGVAILKEDVTAAFVAAFMLLFVTLFVGALAAALPALISAFIAPLIGYVLFALCLIAMLRVARVQLLSLGYVIQVIRRCGVALLLTTLPPALLAFTLPWLISIKAGMMAWGLLLFPGLPIIAYFLFVPLLVIDRDISVSGAFSLNHRIVKQQGFELLATVVALLAVNILVAPLIVGLLVTLPITLLALMLVYDRHFYET